MSKKIDTDLATFVKFWLVPLGLVAMIFLIKQSLAGLVIIGISIFLALALRPLVHRVNNLFTKLFGKDKKHQNISAIFAYLIVVIVIGAILAIVGPVVVNETARFAQNIPETFETTLGGWDGINNLGRSVGVADLRAEIMKAINGISNNLLSILGNNIMSGVGSVADIMMKVALTLVLTLLFLLEGPGILDAMWDRLDDKENNSKMVAVARRTLGRMGDVVSTYVSRQMIVAVLDGCATIIIVFVLSLVLKFSASLAVPMGMIAMVFYLIPMFGQFIGGTLVTILLFFSNQFAALSFAIIYIIYSQIENNLIAPKIQGDALNLKAVVILSAVTIGMYTFGLLGAIISIPIAGCIRVLMEEYPNFRAAKE